MRSILEQIKKMEGSSFRLMVDPNLHDFYYWHFHPELELVYIEGVNGTRHIGNHKSFYTNGDLAFIGPFIPHLNFDYGVKEKYHKIVLQFDESILRPFGGNIPELEKIERLIKDSRHGIVFSSEMKNKIGPRMKSLVELQGFDLFQEVLRILSMLASHKTYTLLHDKPYKNQFYEKQQEKFRKVLAYIERNYQNKIKVEDLAKECNYSEGAFCRYFKKMTKLTFTQFLNNYRIDIAKKHLIEGKNVSEAAYSSGFESLSYFNRVFKRTIGSGPREWLKQNLGQITV